MQPLTLAAPHAKKVDAGLQAAPPTVSVRSAPVAFTLSEDGFASSRQTTAMTVAAALAEGGVALNDADIVRPSREALLTPGMRIYIDYARRVEVLMGGAQVDVFTHGGTVEEALRGAGFDLQADDLVFPPRTTAVRQGMVIGLTLVREVTLAEDTPIPHGTLYRYDSSLANGRQVVIQAGADGAIHRQYNVTQVNGKENSRRLLSETTVPATTAIVAIGTHGDASAAAPVDVECSLRKTVWATYYTAASAGGNGVTRTGTGVYKGIIATDPSVIPLGTRMYVPGYGYGIAADTGGGVRGWHIDLGYGADDVYDWGSQYVEICIY